MGEKSLQYLIAGIVEFWEKQLIILLPIDVHFLKNNTDGLEIAFSNSFHQSQAIECDQLFFSFGIIKTET